MHFLVKMSENSRKKIFRNYETKKKVPLILFNVKVATKKDNNFIFVVSIKRLKTSK